MTIETRLAEHVAAHGAPSRGCVFCDGADDQPRDESGKWTSGGSGGSSGGMSHYSSAEGAKVARARAGAARYQLSKQSQRIKEARSAHQMGVATPADKAILERHGYLPNTGVSGNPHATSSDGELWGKFKDLRARTSSPEEMRSHPDYKNLAEEAKSRGFKELGELAKSAAREKQLGMPVYSGKLNA